MAALIAALASTLAYSPSLTNKTWYRLEAPSTHLKVASCRDIAEGIYGDPEGTCAEHGYTEVCTSCMLSMEFKVEKTGTCDQKHTECYFRAPGETCVGISQCPYIAPPVEVATGPLPHTGTNALKAGGGGSCSYSYSSHAGAPVVTKASCHITKADLDKGCKTNSATQAYARKLGGHDGVHNDDAGHILAHRLGGDGTQPTNIVPQAPHLNRGDWEAFERAIYACVTGSVKASLSWTFSYSSTSKQRPDKMSYSASYSSGCSSAHQSFENTPGLDLLANRTEA